jgi:hypothetical protein
MQINFSLQWLRVCTENQVRLCHTIQSAVKRYGMQHLHSALRSLTASYTSFIQASYGFFNLQQRIISFLVPVPHSTSFFLIFDSTDCICHIQMTQDEKYNTENFLSSYVKFILEGRSCKTKSVHSMKETNLRAI